MLILVGARLAASRSGKGEMGRAEQRGGGEPSARGDRTTQHRQRKGKRKSGRGKSEREQERGHLSKVAAHETPVHMDHAGVQSDMWAPVAQTSEICLVTCNNHQSQLHSCLCDFCAARLIDP